MAEFLSAEWISELDAAAARVAGLERLDTELVIEQVVRGAPDGDVRYQVRLLPTGAHVVIGGDSPADLVLVTDYATACTLHAGVTRAQDALAAGALKVRGRPEVLARQSELLEALDDAFAPVRARTTFAGEAARQAPGER
jgi:hypothetical protein